MSLGIRPQWTEALDRNITKWSEDAFKGYTGFWTKYAKQMTSNADREHYMGSSGFGNPTRTAEGGDIGVGEKIKRYEVVITNQKYTDSHEVSKEANDDIKFPILGKSAAAQFGKSFAMFEDKKMAAMLRNAFSTSYPVYGAKQLISTIHPTKKAGGSTRSNAILDSGSLMPVFSADAASTARKLLMEQTDDQGEIINYAGEKILLIVTEKNAEAAYQLAKTDKVPDTAENAINFFKSGVTMDVLVLPYLSDKQGVLDGDLAGSDDYWFMMVPNAPYGLIYQKREGFSTETWYEPSNQTHFTSGTVRFGTGCDGFEFIVGSDGTTTTFTD